MEFAVELWNLAGKSSWRTITPSAEIADTIAQNLTDMHSKGWILTHIVPVSNNNINHGNTQAYYHFQRPQS